MSDTTHAIAYRLESSRQHNTWWPCVSNKYQDRSQVRFIVTKYWSVL